VTNLPRPERHETAGVDGLSPRARYVIALRQGGSTYREIGLALGVSRAYAHQVAKAAAARLGWPRAPLLARRRMCGACRRRVPVADWRGRRCRACRSRLCEHCSAVFYPLSCTRWCDDCRWLAIPCASCGAPVRVARRDLQRVLRRGQKHWYCSRRCHGRAWGLRNRKREG
jgi:hypothetical protein